MRLTAEDRSKIREDFKAQELAVVLASTGAYDPTKMVRAKVYSGLISEADYIKKIEDAEKIKVEA